MARFMAAGHTGDFNDGTMKEVRLQERGILLARAGGRYYAVDGRCPHLGGNLAQGKLYGTIVTCPRHGSQFDITDGRVIRWLKSPGLISTISKVFKPPSKLKTYRVRIEGDNILIEI